MKTSQRLRRPRLFPMAACLALTSLTVAGAVEPRHAPLAMKSPVLDKNFYLLTLMERTPGVRAAVNSDVALHQIATARREAMDRAANSCKEDLECNTQAFRWNDSDILEAGSALAALYRKSPAFRESLTARCAPADCMFCIRT